MWRRKLPIPIAVHDQNLTKINRLTASPGPPPRSTVMRYPGGGGWGNTSGWDGGGGGGGGMDSIGGEMSGAVVIVVAVVVAAWIQSAVELAGTVVVVVEVVVVARGLLRVEVMRGAKGVDGLEILEAVAKAANIHSENHKS
ncbi:hypothetical protein JB92DRAFT_2836995 [Gautieria morchelliformis]|nr:hypothetical protein JB92DRAFT_2836995 [Gautieria morchelliformis]